MRGALLCIFASWGFVVSHFFTPEIAHASVITIVNLDGAGEGFNDPSPPDSASTAGGNNGATLGAQRLIAFQRVADIWGSFISSPVEIRVDATFDPLTCTSTSATLGSTGTRTVHRDFAGAPLANTWYPQALANSRAGTDLSPGISDIATRFNSAIGTTCPFPLGWYYGLDRNPPGEALDFVSVVLHELGHGLGFQSFVDLATGAKLGAPGPVFDDVFSRNLEDHSTGKLYPQMTDAERVSASQNSGNLHWVGPNVVTASGTLTAGVHATGHVQMYAPNPQDPGSSVSHFDTALTPNELMEPFYTSPNHNLGLTLDLLDDLGWITLSGFTDVDFDGDGKADIGIYRNGAWSIIRSSDGGVSNFGWGGAAWEPVVADYDGDGIADIAVYNANGLWSIVRSSDGGNTLIGWSGAAGDIPVPADYDGDGKADLAVYNKASAGWSIIRSSDGGLTYKTWGGPPWEPVAADYDGDGKTDIAVYNANGLWSIVRSSDGGNTLIGWSGAAGDIPVPADYDGDGKADLALYNTASAGWSIIRTTDGGLTYRAWGGPAWEPVAADYDGDGKADIAVYNASNGLWSIVRSSDGGNTLVGLGGAPQDIPLSAQ